MNDVKSGRRNGKVIAVKTLSTGYLETRFDCTLRHNKDTRVSRFYVCFIHCIPNEIANVPSFATPILVAAQDCSSFCVFAVDFGAARHSFMKPPSLFIPVH